MAPLLSAQEALGGFVSVPTADAASGAAGGASLGGFGTSSASSGGVQSTQGSASPSYPDYRISAFDVLKLWVYQANEFSIPVRVDQDGDIRLPLCQEPIKVGGLTPVESEKVIAQGLVDEGLLVEPVVMVQVTETHSQPILVSGAVASPTIFQVPAPVTLLEALSRAGGLLPTAGEYIVIERRTQDGVLASQSQVSREEFIGGVQSAQLLQVYGGETIRVPAAPTAFVIGANARSGPIPLSDAAGVDFFEFMAQAGVQPSSKHRKAVIFRPRQGSMGLEKDQIEVNLKKVATFEVANITVKPDDVVYFIESDSLANGIMRRASDLLLYQGMWRLGALIFR